MKEFIGWLRWSISGLETWKRWFFLAIFLNFGSILFPDPYHWWINGAGMAIVCFFMLKWFVWDQLVVSWNKYKEHRNELFSTIKESDQR